MPIAAFQNELDAIPESSILPKNLVLKNLVMRVSDASTYTPPDPYVQTNCTRSVSFNDTARPPSPAASGATPLSRPTTAVPNPYRRPTQRLVTRGPFQTGAPEQCKACGLYGHTHKHCRFLGQFANCQLFHASRAADVAAVAAAWLRTNDRSERLAAVNQMGILLSEQYQDVPDNVLLEELDNMAPDQDFH